MNLSAFDILKICGYITTLGTGLIAGLPSTGLFPSNEFTKISGVLSLIVLIATLVANAIKNQSAPAGTTAAFIPIGTIPVVGAPNVPNTPQVAKIDPSVTIVTTISKGA